MGPHEGAGPVPAGGVYAGDEVCGQSLGVQGAAQGRHDGGVGVLGCAAAAQDDGVAGLDGQGGGIDRNIGAGLVDHADDTQGHPHPAHPQPVWHDRAVNDLADGVGQSGDLPQGSGDVGQTTGVQGEAVQEPGLHPGLASTLQVGGIGGAGRAGSCGDELVGVDVVHGATIEEETPAGGVSGRENH